ncbi:lycopene cyclase domain-containing protein [Cellulomonas sp. JH27-2]|uniref:lycopene cyclase domain-containing protein n=1 Tax=Cellulomonas sp. JH27-2 TaxID=2774139 RepID=UPI001781B9C5|nr:lycopene cyclase domain-containing protein [Cellulomonas sp. JH27-2]MBD8058658.1 lycopene cyclase domain-containing protein [Cellulomonas sp. JH27-2]
MRGWYLTFELVSLACIVALDARYRLFLWADLRRGLVVLVTGVVFFLAWDVVAIHEGFYGRGKGSAMLGVEVAPHLPVEELVFITFLTYLTMVVLAMVRRGLAAGEGR